ncbi:GNAT family N-acetyltransferase [Paracoccus aminophilus]|uniref:GCN5-like N-acetyltransferase n=1 Tax=Paracoccus aminophilus JCM 7686 TaxID=1367847 RepID=S5YRY6_PARAH|nr:GNAT family N-acetyltransferase [Paracoccus aminophilus]AGT07996.1 GCN5-like N-acetyltransferase [Paracoccus aminophilus JCM 7686]
MRITLGRARAADTPAISVALMDPAVSSWLKTFPFPYDRDAVLAEEVETGLAGDFAILVNGGFAGLVLARPELGCWVDPKFQGRGVGTRASMLALSRHFATGAETAHARCRADNLAMRPVLARLGFVPDEAARSIPGELELHRLSRKDFATAQPFRLRTARCRVEGARPEDAEDLYDLASRRAVLCMQGPLHAGLGFESFARMIHPFAGGLPFSARIMVEDRAIGMIGIGPGPEALLYFCLAPEVTGLGFASEVVPAFCAEIFDRYGVQAILGDVVPGNAASVRLLERAGFAFEGPAMIHSAGRTPEMGMRYRLKNPE